MSNFFVKTKEAETKVKNKPETKVKNKPETKAKVKSNLILPKSKHKKQQDQRTFAEKLESLNLSLKGLDIAETRPEPEQSRPELEHDYNALLDLIVEQDKRIDLLTRLVGQYREDNSRVLDIQESILERLFNVETDLYN